MRKGLLQLLCFLFVFDSVAQQNDNIWPLAYYYGPGSIYFYNLDFSNGNPDTVVYQRKMRFFNTNATISDTSGSLLFYTNGVWVSNAMHDTLFNSQNFNPGWATNYYINSGMGLSQSAIVVPFNDTSNYYYLIYETAEPFTNVDGDFDTQPFHLSYSLIDMALDSGKGGIVQNFKNIKPIQDTLILGRITACKHANGRDWWVIVHKYYSDLYYKVLFTPYGTLGPFIQQIGSMFYPKVLNGVDFDLLGMSIFSPDGTKYVDINYDTIQLFDFDRCSGLLSNFRTAFPLTDSLRILGCSFSPNSQFLYANTRLKAFQFNTDSFNINATTILIAEYDSFVNPFETWFFLNQLGSNGKIYISTYNGSYSLHVIENPDSSGLACNFNQHSFQLPSNYGGNATLPNFPNYRLGRLIGSPCDTLTGIVESEIIRNELKIFPNPNDGSFVINYSLPQNRSGTLEIFDVNGRKVYSQNLPQWSTLQMIKLPELADGIYNCVITSGYERAFKKMAVIKE